ncbi:hypothetical protein, partial [Enterococcus faecium]
ENGFLVNKNKVELYVDAIKKLFENNNLRENIKKNNMKRINNYDTQKINQKMYTIYKDKMFSN